MTESAAWFRIRPRGGEKPSLPKGALRISLPKRIVPLATRRNRLKRILKEALRRTAPDRAGRPGIEIMVIRDPKEGPELERTVRDLQGTLARADSKSPREFNT